MGCFYLFAFALVSLFATALLQVAGALLRVTCSVIELIYTMAKLGFDLVTGREL